MYFGLALHTSNRVSGPSHRLFFLRQNVGIQADSSLREMNLHPAAIEPLGQVDLIMHCCVLPEEALVVLELLAIAAAHFDRSALKQHLSD
jgi:hypothetical protein